MQSWTTNILTHCNDFCLASCSNVIEPSCKHIQNFQGNLLPTMLFSKGFVENRLKITEISVYTELFYKIISWLFNGGENWWNSWSHGKS